MKNLQEATERICELKGITAAQDAALAALAQILPCEARAEWARSLGTTAEVVTTILMNADVSEITIDAFGREVGRWRWLLRVEAPSAQATCSENAAPASACGAVAAAPGTATGVPAG